MDNQRICTAEFQAFVDCMYVYSNCVQSGSKPFSECVNDELANQSMHLDCLQKHRLYMICWRQIVKTCQLYYWSVA